MELYWWDYKGVYCFDKGGDARRTAWRFLPIFLKQLYTNFADL